LKEQILRLTNPNPPSPLYYSHHDIEVLCRGEVIYGDDHMLSYISRTRWEDVEVGEMVLTYQLKEEEGE